MFKRYLLFFVLIVLIAFQSAGQGLLCEESEPFCTGSIYTFPAGTTGQAQYGAYYDCLSTQPAPAWYHLLIDDPGSITIYMYSTPLVDIDFCCWGPFTDPWEPCVQGLTANTVVDCSYSPAPTEYCVIPNGQTGQYYILLITNYSQQPCEITFSQTAGNGSTDCTILPPPVGNNGPLCVGETLQLYADTINNAQYYWSGPNGFLSTQQNPIIPNVTLNNAGAYSCVITVNGQSSDPAITNVVIYSLPGAVLTSPDTTVCPGEPAYAIFNFTGWGPFKVTYNNGSNTFIQPGLYGPVDTIFLYPPVPTMYTFTKVEDLHCAKMLLFMDMYVNTYPETSGTMTGSAEICAGEPVELTFELTGSPPWDITYTTNGSNPQTVGANSSPYILPVYPTVPTTYEFTAVEDIYCSGLASGVVEADVDPSPTANAGNDKTIPYGTSTTLNGQASGGSGNYQYSWQPAAKLTNPTAQNPLTVNLTESTLFTLTATDNVGGCYDLDDIMVSLSGGPLGCIPVADPPAVCTGDPSHLLPYVSGGSGTYTYLWSSNPPGFSSYLPDPVVTPAQTTTYSVQINDGYNVISGNVTVTVHPSPIPDAGEDVTIPHGTNTILHGSAGNGSGNYAYHWEPADLLVDPNVASPQTENIYGTTTFSLFVTDLTTSCESQSPDVMTLIISGGPLAVVPAAYPETVCLGETVKLYANAGGGAGAENYQYSWLGSDGFNSTLQNPEVTPNQVGTIYYTCTLDDSFNTTFGSVAVNVLTTPEIDFGFTSKTVCVFDTVILDPDVPNASYLWSNGATTQTIRAASTGIGFDMQTYTVTVTSLSGGCQSEQSVNVIFDFTACTGVGEDLSSAICQIYPNPGDGNIRMIFDPELKQAEIDVLSIQGYPVSDVFTYYKSLMNNELILPVGYLSEGMYFIRISDKKGINQLYKYILRK